jgi:hypothetical protein
MNVSSVTRDIQDAMPLRDIRTRAQPDSTPKEKYIYDERIFGGPTPRQSLGSPLRSTGPIKHIVMIQRIGALRRDILRSKNLTG